MAKLSRRSIALIALVSIVGIALAFVVLWWWWDSRSRAAELDTPGHAVDACEAYESAKLLVHELVVGGVATEDDARELQSTTDRVIDMGKDNPAESQALMVRGIVVSLSDAVDRFLRKLAARAHHARARLAVTALVDSATACALLHWTDLKEDARRTWESAVDALLTRIAPESTGDNLMNEPIEPSMPPQAGEALDAAACTLPYCRTN